MLAGALVVPRHGKKVGYLLAGIQLILAGFFLCFALFTRDHSLIWGLAGGVIGAGHIAYKISVDDIQVEEPEGNEYSPLRAEVEQLIQESKVLKDSKATTPMNNGE